MIKTCVYLHPLVKSYLEKAVTDPASPGFKLSYSGIINLAVAQYSKTINLPPPKRRGRPPRAWDGLDRRSEEEPLKSAKEVASEPKGGKNQKFIGALYEWEERDGSLEDRPKQSDYPPND